MHLRQCATDTYKQVQELKHNRAVHRNKNCVLSYFILGSGTTTGQPQEMHTDTATQAAEMEQKQLKRGNVSKQHKGRENSREMLSKVTYKSDTMSQRQVVAGVR